MADGAAEKTEQKRPGKGSFGSVHPKGGRPKGRKNTSTLIAERIGGKDLLQRLEVGDPSLNLPPAYLRWAELLKDKNHGIRFMAERYLHEALYGKPKQQVEVKGVLSIDPMLTLKRAAEAARAEMAQHPEQHPVIDVTPLKQLAAAPGNGNGHK